MKVGEILKSEIKDIPSLKYPYKVLINEQFSYPENKKYENAILFNNCNSLLSSFPSKKSLKKHRSHSQKKNLIFNNKMLTKEFYLKTNSDKFGKTSKPSIFEENLPVIKNKTPKANIKIYASSSKFDPIFYNDCLLIRNKIKKLKNNTNNIKYMTFYKPKKEKENNNPLFKERTQTQINQSKQKNNIFNYILRNKNNKINQKQYTQTVFESKINKRIKKLNQIINRLNTPLFAYNKTEF